MKKRVLSLILAAVLVCALLPTAALAAKLPQAGIRDIQIHDWTQYSQEKLTPEPLADVNVYDYGWYGYTANPGFLLNGYKWGEIENESVAYLVLYDNGELYLSQKAEPGNSDFKKVMDHVKEIGTVTVPTYFIHRERKQKRGACITEALLTVRLTTILTEDGKLYLMGVPQSIPEENHQLEVTTTPSGYSEGFRETVTFTNLFPFDFSYSQENAILVAEGISHIVPGYSYSQTLQYYYPAYFGEPGYGTQSSGTSIGYSGFYVDDRGDCYVGFPIEEAKGEKQTTNVVNYLPGKDPIKMLEDGSLVCNGRTVATNVKDFNGTYYLTNDGKVYDYNGKLLNHDVKTLCGGNTTWGVHYASSDDEGFRTFQNACYIKEDGSLWGALNNDKLMEDVEAVFDRQFVVRANGDVYRLEEDDNNATIVREFLSGNGFAPSPAPAIHAGKIFKDASSWALVDLRAARDSGLTIPADGLSYNTPITREKFAEVAVKLYEALSGQKAAAVTENPFTDTKNPEILKAYALGIVKGTGEGKFSPNAKIDRESIAVMLLRAVNAGGARLNKGAAVSFSDASSVSSWAKDSVDAMAKAGVIRGVGGNRFDPKGTATVEQAIIMANRILP